MPCLAQELGAVVPFVALWNSEATTKQLKRALPWMARGRLWRVRARHAVPLLKTKERERVSAKYWRHAPRFGLGHRQECLCY